MEGRAGSTKSASPWGEAAVSLTFAFHDFGEGAGESRHPLLPNDNYSFPVESFNCRSTRSWNSLVAHHHSV